MQELKLPKTKSHWFLGIWHFDTLGSYPRTNAIHLMHIFTKFMQLEQSYEMLCLQEIYMAKKFDNTL